MPEARLAASKGSTEIEFTGKVASPNPELHANIFSRLLWFWLDPLVWRGAKEELTNGDFFYVRSDCLLCSQRPRPHPAVREKSRPHPSGWTGSLPEHGGRGNTEILFNSEKLQTKFMAARITEEWRLEQKKPKEKQNLVNVLVRSIAVTGELPPYACGTLTLRFRWDAHSRGMYLRGDHHTQWRTFGWQYLSVVLIGLTASAGRISQAVVLFYLLAAFANPTSTDTEVAPKGEDGGGSGTPTS